jgi:hypothetical protein
MHRATACLAVVGLWVGFASAARAQDEAPGGVFPQPGRGDIGRAVDQYMAGAAADPALVGGAGGAGYDGGFWIRGGEFSLRATILLQARWEAFAWEDSAAAPSPGGDLSGFSIPRSALLLTGTAPCDVSWLALLEFGHHGGPPDNPQNADAQFFFDGGEADGTSPPNDLREAWIEWGPDRAFHVRAGHIKLPGTRQLMVPAGTQQFVDLALGTAYTGHALPGYQDRNRDYGILLHGEFCDFAYLFAVSNGDGARLRNVLDVRSSDNLGFSARVDWDVIGDMGYVEGAVLQNTCEWNLSVGAWGSFYADRSDRPHVAFGDRLGYGVDVAAGYGGLSLTAALSFVTQEESDVGVEFDGWAWLAQVGYLFPQSPWEIAVRGSGYRHETSFAGDFGADEIAAAVIYYLNGHRNKIQLDVARILPAEDGNVLFDVMAGYNANGPGDRSSEATLIRLQWQLVL